jgi:hypothetical protein
LKVAGEYKRRQLPIDLIVVDFFHWSLEGEWKFDPTYWPDPDAMVNVSYWYLTDGFYMAYCGQSVTELL